MSMPLGILEDPSAADAKRRKLRAAFVAGGAGVDAAVAAAEGCQREELAFDGGLCPALEFMGWMGVWQDEIFGAFLRQQAAVQLAEACRTSPVEAVEQVLVEMLPHAATEPVPDFIAVALQRLLVLRPERGGQPKSLEQAALETRALRELARAFQDDPDRVTKLPSEVRNRVQALVWKIYPEKLRERMWPFVVDFVHAARRCSGVMLEDLKKNTPEKRRQENAALQGLVDLVGTERETYKLIAQELQVAFQEASQSDTPAVRNPPASDDGVGLPISVGVEPLLSTLRSQLLLSLVDTSVKSLSGVWSMTSEIAGKKAQCKLTLTLQGSTVSGTAELGSGNAARTVEGRLQGTRFNFKQKGNDADFACACEVAPDFNGLIRGKIREMPNGTVGTWTAARAGPSQVGQDWDEMAPLIVLLDQTHQRGAAVDAAACKELCSIAAIFAGLPECEPAGPAAAFVLIDPWIAVSLIRGLLSAGRAADPSEPLGPAPRTMLHLLLSAGGLLSPPPAADAVPEFRALKGGPLSLDAMALAGLPCMPLAAAFQQHKSIKDLERPCGELAEVLMEASRAQPRTSPAFMCARLVLGGLATKCLLFKQRLALEDCLQLVAEHAPIQPDWAQRQLVDMLLSAAMHLGEYFDVGLRKAVTAFLIPLTFHDAWVHSRVAELLGAEDVGIFVRPNFTTAREEINALERLLGEAKCADEHCDWREVLSRQYKRMVSGKGYLHACYRKSELGSDFPLDEE